MSASLN